MRMNQPELEKLEKLNLNSYEAVIVASQHARYLNSKRLAKLEQMEEDPEISIECRKITAVALQDVLAGKVKFKRDDSM